MLEIAVRYWSPMADQQCLPHPRAYRALALAASLAAATLLATGCGIFHDKTELEESKRVSDCRSDARRACRKLAKQDEALDVDECASDRAWRCALGQPEPAEPAKPAKPVN
jgi:hypothetical protein